MTKPVPPVLRGPILVGVTIDGRSDNALRAALELGRRLDARVELVHGVPEAHGTPGAAVDTREHVLSQARATIAAHVDGLPDFAAEATPQSERHRARLSERLSERLFVAAGKPAQVLLDRAAAIGAGLLVLGPHQKRGFIDFGSTARALLSEARAPVWVQVEASRPIQRVIAAVDLSEGSRESLAFAADLARRLSAGLTVVSCFVPPDFAYPTHPDPSLPTYVVDEQRQLARAELAELVAAQGLDDLRPVVSFVESEPTAHLLGLQGPGDLLVMATHGRGGFAAAVLGSVTYAVLRSSHGPVVAVRPARWRDSA